MLGTGCESLRCPALLHSPPAVTLPCSARRCVTQVLASAHVPVSCETIHCLLLLIPLIASPSIIASDSLPLSKWLAQPPFLFPVYVLLLAGTSVEVKLVPSEDVRVQERGLGAKCSVFFALLEEGDKEFFGLCAQGRAKALKCCEVLDNS